MTIRLNPFLFILLFISYNLIGQGERSSKSNSKDEITINNQQNKSLGMGHSTYSAKPKNAWELGVHLGHLFIDGDVDSRIPGGYGVGLHLRKAIHYVFSLRADFMYGQSKGIDPQGWTTPNFGGGLVEVGSTGNFQGYAPYTALSEGWNPSYKTTQGYLAMQGVINIGNLMFHTDRNKWNWYTAFGIGLSSHKAELDLLDASGRPYTGLAAIRGTEEKFNTRSGRKEIIDGLDATYDGNYETPGFKKAGIFRLSDEINIHVVFTTSMGVSRKISKRINVGLEHQLILSDNDYLDGIKFRTAQDQTNGNDVSHYTNLRIGINLGNFDKVTEPLYWLNPLEAQMNDIAMLKQLPSLDLTDTDGDGVIDLLDQETDSPAGAPVDVKGIVLDSDKDGFPDYRDQEPFSPLYVPVNKEGVAVIKCCFDMDDVNKAIEMRSGNLGNSDCGKWFLPSIHFDVDKTIVKSEYYGHLHHIAQVMKMCPELCISVFGYVDSSSKNKNAESLAYGRAENVVNYLIAQYGIEKSRIKIMYGTDASPAFSNIYKESYMNRRVDVKVCQINDTDMKKPTTSEKSKKKNSTKDHLNSKFKGNKSTGF